jgi:hypothetical protein
MKLKLAPLFNRYRRKQLQSALYHQMCLLALQPSEHRRACNLSKAKHYSPCEEKKTVVYQWALLQTEIKRFHAQCFVETKFCKVGISVETSNERAILK